MSISDSDQAQQVQKSLKADQRSRARATLQKISEKDQKSFTIRERIRTFVAPYLENKDRLVCGIFMGLPSEPNLRELVMDPEIQPDLENVHWAMPRILGTDLKFYVFDSEDRSEQFFDTNEFGIEEPRPERSQEITASQMDIIFIPGLAFDKKMNRLGRGMAFYDRFLNNFTGVKVGISFQDQILDENIVIEPHDIKMDWLITETCIYKMTEKKRTA